MSSRLILVVIVALSFSSTFVNGQSISAEELLKKSINYHDPKDILTSKEVTFELGEERPNGETRNTTINIDIPAETVSIASKREGHQINSQWQAGVTSSTIDGNADISDEDIKKYRLTTERLTIMKDYYRYLWHLPTTLLDPGTIIDPKVKQVDFFGQSLLEIKVTYEATIGKDIWYFYFNPESFALSGYRFYHDESANDGEYILLSGETKTKSLRLPSRREWYTHKEDKLLGADILEVIVIDN